MITKTCMLAIVGLIICNEACAADQDQQHLQREEKTELSLEEQAIIDQIAEAYVDAFIENKLEYEYSLRNIRDICFDCLDKNSLTLDPHNIIAKKWKQGHHLMLRDFIVSIFGQCGIGMMLAYKLNAFVGSAPLLWIGAGILGAAGIYGFMRIIVICVEDCKYDNSMEFITNTTIDIKAAIIKSAARYIASMDGLARFNDI